MALRQTVLFAWLLTMACSASAHEYVCTVENTRPVAIASFRFTKEDLLREQASHGEKPCPLPEYNIVRRLGETASTGQSSPVNPNSPLRMTPGGSNEAGDAGMCGVVDKPHAQFHVASATVYRYCTKQAAKSATSMSTAKRPIRAYDGIGFKVTRPAVYNSKQHHMAYTYAAGDLVGTCYVCVLKQTPTSGTQTGNAIPPPRD